jgi:hypothetical protein
MMCLRCKLYGFRVLAVEGHFCPSPDERDRCRRCGQMRFVVTLIVDARGSLSEPRPCPCLREE